MYVYDAKNYDLEKTLMCGQVFRVKWKGQRTYKVIAGSNACYVSTTNHNSMVVNVLGGECPEKYDFWTDYFNAEDDSMEELAEMVKGNDYLEEVVQFNQGLHLLHQDPWEILVSILCSVQKKIPQTMKCIEALCTRNGQLRKGGFHAFPTAGELITGSMTDARLGYREKYIEGTAYHVYEDLIDLNALKSPNTTYLDACCRLKRLPGVGQKVADCVCLFGLGYGEAFPVDTHIHQMLARPELKGFNYHDYGKHAGLLQQCLFYWDLKHPVSV